MGIELTGTTASEIAAALLSERRKAGSPAMGMVLTLVVVTDEGDHYDAIKVAKSVSREHPSRILGIIRRPGRSAPNLDAEVSIGGSGSSGETVIARLSGDLARHSESVVLPLLLPDSPVVVWWPRRAPDDPAEDPIGALAQRRITDCAASDRTASKALLTQAVNYSPGNTDLSWTRLTPWRALLAAALDQYPARIRSGRVEAERNNPSADLLVAWLWSRLRVQVDRTYSKGPGLTSVVMSTGGGDIEICRPDGRLAQFSIPNSPNRPVALKRRDTAELLAEELRRLDPDDVYADTVQALCRLAGRTAKADVPQTGSRRTSTSTRAQTARHSQTKNGPGRDGPRKGGSTTRAARRR